MSDAVELAEVPEPFDFECWADSAAVGRPVAAGIRTQRTGVSRVRFQ
jgi:hypothetical protein